MQRSSSFATFGTASSDDRHVQFNLPPDTLVPERERLHGAYALPRRRPHAAVDFDTDDCADSDDDDEYRPTVIQLGYHDPAGLAGCEVVDGVQETAQQRCGGGFLEQAFSGGGGGFQGCFDEPEMLAFASRAQSVFGALVPQQPQLQQQQQPYCLTPPNYVLEPSKWTCYSLDGSNNADNDANMRIALHTRAALLQRTAGSDSSRGARADPARDFRPGVSYLAALPPLPAGTRLCNECVVGRKPSSVALSSSGSSSSASGPSLICVAQQDEHVEHDICEDCSSVGAVRRSRSRQLFRRRLDLVSDDLVAA